jgi:hypothetical protein
MARSATNRPMNDWDRLLDLAGYRSGSAQDLQGLVMIT